MIRLTANLPPTDDQVRRLAGSGARRVHCPAFDIDRTPVTNAEYAVFVEAVGYPEPERFKEALAEAPDHPVTSVNWKDALCYSLWRGRRLPTPLEWEKAARGPEDDRVHPWGSTFEDERCVHRGPGAAVAPGGGPCRRDRSAGCPRGSPPFGVDDLVGNVNEWVSEGTVPGYRGACGGAAGEMLSVYGLVSYQSQARVDYAGVAIGFRCAADTVYDLEPHDPARPGQGPADHGTTHDTTGATTT